MTEIKIKYTLNFCIFMSLHFRGLILCNLCCLFPGNNNNNKSDINPIPVNLQFWSISEPITRALQFPISAAFSSTTTTRAPTKTTTIAKQYDRNQIPVNLQYLCRILTGNNHNSNNKTRTIATTKNMTEIQTLLTYNFGRSITQPVGYCSFQSLPPFDH